MRRTSTLVALLTAAIVAVAGLGTEPARAESGGSSPYAGAAVTEGERLLSSAASRIVGREAAVNCNTADEWTALAALLRFEPDAIVGFVPTIEGTDADHTELSPSTCADLAAFVGAKRQSPCLLGKRAVRRVRDLHGRSVTVRAHVPRWGACTQSDVAVDAVWTLTHESLHIGGLTSEEAAECLGMQLVPWAATMLGANLRYGIEMGERAWQLYRHNRYYTPECRAGGPLDLDGASASWPQAPAGVVARALVLQLGLR